MIETLTSLGFIIPVVVIVFSIVCHEVAHGFAAYLHGDNTAHDAGRLTLNPVPHIDLFGSIILPAMSSFTGFILGWAKPVPYNPHNLKGRFAETWVASAGVLTNFLLAAMAIIAFKSLNASGGLAESTQAILMTIIWVNISLGIFNLIPVPPFDGLAIINSLFPKTRIISSSLTHNPFFMIGAIILAIFIFSMLIPFIAGFIQYIL